MLKGLIVYAQYVAAQFFIGPGIIVIGPGIIVKNFGKVILSA